MATRLDVDEFLDRAVQLLRSEEGVQRVVLFGSHAWGKARPDSDVDLLVIIDSPDPPFERALAVRRLLEKTHVRVPLDVLTLTPGELRERLRIGDQFVEEIVRRGRVLYGA